MPQRRDSQRSAVYAWESRCNLLTMRMSEVKPMSADQCRQMISRVWECYTGGVHDAPEWKPGRGRRSACYMHYDHSIRMPVWSRQPAMVLHELAHAAVFVKEPEAAGHGPEFVRVYCEMLVAYEGYCPEFLIGEMTTGKRRVRMAKLMQLNWRK